MSWTAPCGCKVGALMVPEVPIGLGYTIPFPIRHEPSCSKYEPPPAGALTIAGGVPLLGLCGCPWVQVIGVDSPTVKHRDGCPAASR